MDGKWMIKYLCSKRYLLFAPWNGVVYAFVMSFPSAHESCVFRKQLERSIASLHHCSSNPDWTNRVEVSSSTLLTALSAIPLVSNRCGVDLS